MCVYVLLKFGDILIVFNTFSGILVNTLFFRVYMCIVFHFPQPNFLTLITLTSSVTIAKHTQISNKHLYLPNQANCTSIHFNIPTTIDQPDQVSHLDKPPDHISGRCNVPLAQIKK